MRRLGAILLGVLMVLTPVASALPTPGLFGEEARMATGRIFPEAGETNDFVGISEAIEGLQLLAEENPDLLTYHEIGQSVGWDNAAGGHDRQPVFAVTVTNENSTVPETEKLNLLFMLSIHGNEKGGREGGVRVIEDFTKAWNDQQDTGMATEERVEMLDYARLIFLFPNPDGWAHEEAEYRHNDACYASASCGGFPLGGPQVTEPGEPGAETQNFVRVNGNGTDLNRQAPTIGWNRGESGDISHSSMREPEPQAYWDWLTTNFTDIDLASDLHGMLQPANALVPSSPEVECVSPPALPAGPGEVCLRKGNFVLTMLPAAQMTAPEMAVTTTLAEQVKKDLNTNPYFREWQNAPEGGVWGGEFNDWGTVWDTLGYVDSGFSSDFFAQNHGLDAPGVDFEFAYNHITFDNYYPGLAQRLNAYHVEATRTIVGTFMDVAQERFNVTVDTNDRSTAYVPTDYLATSGDNDELTGWAAENPGDDAFDWAHGGGYNATPNAYFLDLAGYTASEAGQPVLAAVQPDQLGGLEAYDNLVIAGSSAERLLDDETALDAVKAFVEDGGNLLLTDEALRLLAPLGVVDGDAVEEQTAYAGHTNFVDREHPLADGVRGLARQTFEPMPLGFSIAANDGEGSVPVWTVNRSSFEEAGGETVGVLEVGQANLGQVTVGEGNVTILGALLPNPSEKFYHPYGLADYATTYTANQLVRNTLGWELDIDRTPRDNATSPEMTNEAQADDEQLGSASTDEGPNGVPFPGLVASLAALGAALVLARRRR